jgi:hypothetical protein
MALEQREDVRPGECRQCSAYCDKLVEPRGCLEQRCSYLYSYEDRFTGNQYMGCLQKVFRAEVDVDMFELAESTGGYGGLRMTGRPLAQCQFTVEPAYAGAGDGFSCVNRRFFDCSEAGPEGLRAFDLRDAL